MLSRDHVALEGGTERELIETAAFDYKIVSSLDAEVLSHTVLALWQKNWRCCGGVSTVFDQTAARIRFYQAMTRDYTRATVGDVIKAE